MKVDFDIHLSTGRRKRTEIRNGERPEVGPGVPRVAKLMALAIHFHQLLRDGVVADYAELARLGRVTRSRLSQIMGLLNLAPDIQEEILFLMREPGRERVTERSLRAIVAEVDWRRQREVWTVVRRRPN
jgi:hypothetical protein